MSLQRLVVEDLFGEFTHKVDLHAEDGLTLIHGPNGVGKTTVLRIIDALLNRRFGVLARVPFGTLHATFTDGDRVQVRRHRQPTAPDPKRRTSGYQLEFILTDRTGYAKPWTYRRHGPSEFPLHMLDEYIGEITRTGQSEWLDLLTGEVMDLDQVFDKYSDRLPSSARSPQDSTPEWLRDVLSRVPVYFIEAQRLQSFAPARSARFRRVHGEAQPQIPTVALHAEDLAERIKRTLATYGDFSQTLDSTFPTRLLDDQGTTPLDQEAIRTRYNAQADRRNRYVKAGLLDDAGSAFLRLPDRGLEGYEQRVLTMLLDDTEAKLDRLSELSAKLDLFLSIINGKFRRKSLSVDREHGFRVTTADGSPLELSSLSSGEQQEIVLAYGLLFRERPGTLILVDEPELSLHISWQLDLIPDLLKIADLARLEFLVATHSPQVIGDRWDLTVELSDGA